MAQLAVKINLWLTLHCAVGEDEEKRQELCHHPSMGQGMHTVSQPVMGDDEDEDGDDKVNQTICRQRIYYSAVWVSVPVLLQRIINLSN